MKEGWALYSRGANLRHYGIKMKACKVKGFLSFQFEPSKDEETKKQ